MRKKQAFQRRMVRASIQLVFFLAAPALFTTGFSGIKYLFTQIGKGELLELVSFLKVLAGLSLFTVVFGRYFCGFACAFGSLGDAVFAISAKIQKKTKRKLPSIPEAWIERLMWCKYVILGLICVFCLLGIYDRLTGSSPWDVFSMVSALRLPETGYAAGILLLLLILAGMCLEERFFCKFLCPMGAFFALLPILPLSSLRRDRENCIPKCSLCRRGCPARISIDGDSQRSGECLQCNKCMEKCPRGNISGGWGRWKGNETPVVVVKGLLLLGMAALLGAVRFL